MSFFTVLPVNSRPSSLAADEAFLIKDDWNDWFTYQTQYFLIYADEASQQHQIGDVKIGQFDMPKNQSRPDIPETFDGLGDAFFSVGQDQSYYERLNNLPSAI